MAYFECGGGGSGSSGYKIIEQDRNLNIGGSHKLVTLTIPSEVNANNIRKIIYMHRTSNQYNIFFGMRDYKKHKAYMGSYRGTKVFYIAWQEVDWDTINDIGHATYNYMPPKEITSYSYQINTFGDSDSYRLTSYYIYE